MRILVRPAVVGFLLLTVSHLGVPGGVAGQPEFSSLPIQQRAPHDLPEAAAAWRQDAPLGLAGDFDPVLPPVKQTDSLYGSELSVEMRLPPPLPPAPVVQEQKAPPPSTFEAAKPGVQEYEVDDSHYYVRHFIDRFQTGYRRAIVESWLSRSGRYLPMILDVFRQKGLPDDLVFTAMIESGFNPLAVSRAGAKGLWQFMAPTARRYGLRVDDWLDERLDPEKSTMAAARHLADLYAVFGSWNLVQAAYNAGEMKVLQAIRSMGSSDFWTLTGGRVLPDETKNFIPAIQAATLIAREPERYGFVFTPAEPLEYEIVTVPRATSLKLLSLYSGIPQEALERLNLELKLKQTPPDGPYTLKVPVGGSRLVQRTLEQQVSLREAPPARPSDHRRGKLSPGFHVVKPRETIRTIAKRYGISVANLVRWNDLQETAQVRPGDRLRVAAAPKREESQTDLR